MKMRNLKIKYCQTEEEWNAACYFRQHYFFDKAGLQDHYTWTFDHPQHEHFFYILMIKLSVMYISSFGKICEQQ